MMSNFWIDVVNIICASFLALLSFIDNISKRSFANKSKFWQKSLAIVKKVSVKLSVVLLIGLIAVFTNNQKYANIENDKKAADTAFRKELDRREKINQANFNESLTKSSSASSASITQTLAKYYLKYDSSQHHIESIVRDSSSNNIIKPELAIAEIEGVQNADSIRIVTTLKSIQGTVYDAKFSYSYVIRMYPFSLDSKFLKILKFGFQMVRIPLTVDGISETISNRFVNNNFLVNKPKVYVYLFGSYKNAKGKIFKYEDISFYDFSTGKQGDLTTKEYKWIHNYIKAN